VRIDRSNKSVSGVMDRLQMPRRDVSTDSGQSEIHDGFLLNAIEGSRSVYHDMLLVRRFQRLDWEPAIRPPEDRMKKGNRFSQDPVASDTAGNVSA